MTAFYWCCLGLQIAAGVLQMWHVLTKPKTEDRVWSLVATIFVAGTAYFLWVGRP